MPDWMSRERKDLIGSYGAEIVPVSHEQGGFLGSIRMAEEFAARNRNVFLPCQFSNDANAETHETTTGPEIWLQLEGAGRVPDAFVAGVGTGGTVMGVGRFLRRKRAKISVYPVEPLESPTLSSGHKVGRLTPATEFISGPLKAGKSRLANRQSSRSIRPCGATAFRVMAAIQTSRTPLVVVRPDG